LKIDNEAKNSIVPADALLKATITPIVAEQQQSATLDGENLNVETFSNKERLCNAQSLEEISRDRVAAIRDQLASGSYNISGKDVANKILGVLKG
jgi:anti-sigma28 factor (negative regulator of flagellin synthesis)